jgi:hypothetical protein
VSAGPPADFSLAGELARSAARESSFPRLERAFDDCDEDPPA